MSIAIIDGPPDLLPIFTRFSSASSASISRM
jgi:hypothetical protein